MDRETEARVMFLALFHCSSVQLLQTNRLSGGFKVVVSVYTDLLLGEMFRGAITCSGSTNYRQHFAIINCVSGCSVS